MFAIAVDILPPLTLGWLRSPERESPADGTFATIYVVERRVIVIPDWLG